MASNNKPFLYEIEQAEHKCGLYVWNDLLKSNQEATELYQVFNDDENFPWDHQPKLYGERLMQHAYTHTRSNKFKDFSISKKYSGLLLLEDLCHRIEDRFDGEVSDVFCNRFVDPLHGIDWHKDTYGRHLFVLTLGSERTIQFRDNKTKAVESFRPATGDLYFMPLHLNKTHKHRVCTSAADSDGAEISSRRRSSSSNKEIPPRISFVFFFETPKYAKNFKITWRDKATGFVEGLLQEYHS